MAPDALILFHDLMAPAVAAGLYALRALGWNVKIYHTGQIMGVAWRGSAEPVEHVPDPDMVHWLPAHLHGLPVDGLQQPIRYRQLYDGEWFDCTSWQAEECAANCAEINLGVLADSDAVVRSCAEQIAVLAAYVESLEGGKAYFEEQTANWKEIADDLQEEARGMRAFIAKLQDGIEFFQAAVKEQEKEISLLRKQLMALQTKDEKVSDCPSSNAVVD
jgi:hypothetical protein